MFVCGYNFNKFSRGENMHKVNETKGDNLGNFHFEFICIKYFQTSCPPFKEKI